MNRLQQRGWLEAPQWQAGVYCSQAGAPVLTFLTFTPPSSPFALPYASSTTLFHRISILGCSRARFCRG